MEEEYVKVGCNVEVLFVFDLCLKSGFDKLNLFCCLRILDRYKIWKWEIDVVVLFVDGIFCIEVKYWFGIIMRSEDGLKWI